MNDGLRDIKPLLEIPDHSYYIYLALITVAVLVVMGVIFFLIKTFWLNRQVDIKKIYFKRLESIDWVDSKKSAYDITFLAYHFIDNDRVKEIYEQTIIMLEPYKYRKDVPKVDDETRRQCDFLVHVIEDNLS